MSLLEEVLEAHGGLEPWQSVIAVEADPLLVRIDVDAVRVKRA